VQDAVAGHRRPEAGTLFEGDRRFDIVVRLPDKARDLEAIRRLPMACRCRRGAAHQLSRWARWPR
jgi:Cu/Ag efflux pump CusA